MQTGTLKGFLFFTRYWVSKKKIKVDQKLPKKIVVNTWPYAEANVAAWNVLKNGGSALDAITAGTSRCEELQCDYWGQAVGWGNNPDSTGEVTLDAMIMGMIFVCQSLTFF